MHSTVSAFASSSGSILRLRLRYVFEPLHCMPFIASFKNGVRTSTDPYLKDSHLGFFVNVQVGPQTAPAIPHGSPYPYHPSTTRTSSSLPSAPYPLYTNRPPTTSSLSPSRPTPPPPPPTRQSTSRLSARATSRGTSCECCSVFPQCSKNTTSQALRSSAVRHALSLSSAGAASLH